MPNKVFWLLKTYGLYGLLYRTYYEFSKKIGILKRRYPPISPQKITNNTFIEKELSSKNHGLFLDFDYIDWEFIKNHLDFDSIAQNMQGIYKVFSKTKINYGNPIEWDRHPISKKKFGSNLHWTEIENTPISVGDIKYYWEISRFRFAALLVLAYHCTKNDDYFNHFWECFNSWIESNPPELGVNWRCGQEISIRVLFWTIAYFGFFKNKNFSHSKKVMLLNHIIYSAKHVRKNMNFAYRTVRNNHVITEATMLYVVSTLFPFLKESKRWKKHGKKILEKEALRQIFPDGTYIQYSFNYHRMILELYSLCLFVAKRNKDYLSDSVKKRLLMSVKQLFNLQNDINGRLPNFGSNDGTQLLPFTGKCNYLDYRPQIQTIYYLLTGKKLYNAGDWDIYPYILVGEVFRSTKNAIIQKKESSSYKYGGLHVFRGINSNAFFHCGNYRSRPSQSDMFHFDFWYKGKNILIDTGTYLYNSPDKFEEYSFSPAAHNTIIVDNKFQMLKGKRFLWYNWTRVSINSIYKNNDIDLIEAEHFGYTKLIHRRGILRVHDTWIVVDDIFGKGKTPSIIQRWLLHPNLHIENKDNKIAIFIDQKLNLIMETIHNTETITRISKANDSAPDGWVSFYYGNRAPTTFLDIEPKSGLPIRLITTIYLESNAPNFSINKFKIEDFEIILNGINNKNIFNVTKA